MADFGVLHRNELSGALTGLTRVRRFQQVKDVKDNLIHDFF
jgi:threonyl-tRNA synthetase